ncbi:MULTISPECIES: AbrB/MazE/SpoVT family DNA-binding domain-containing protein [Paenibacillus]|nr:AbrB/MazE/SpoVT family DNA-binding domain-containing protein [Paenibacillus rhizosphaerae]
MMKSIGIVRQVDELGRIVIPVELRRVLGVDEADALEFFIDEEAKYLMFRKLNSGCLFCESIEALSYFKGRLICTSCLRDIRGPEPHLAKLESAIALDSEVKPQEEKKTRGKQVDTRKRLAEVMLTYPNATQVEWAEMLGVTQGYVSYLIRTMKKTNSFN